MKKTVLVGGCSHSAPYYVTRNETWHSLLKEKYDCEIIPHTYSGAGNLFIIDHLIPSRTNLFIKSGSFSETINLGHATSRTRQVTYREWIR